MAEIMTTERIKQKWLEHDEGQIDAAISALLVHEHGRRFLWWLLEIAPVFRQPFTGNALTTSFQCGEQNVGQRILERITSVSPEGYVTMMKEKADERGRRDTELRGANASRRGDEYPDGGDELGEHSDGGDSEGG